MQLHESAGKNEWKNVAEESGHLTFLLEDETGQLLVEPSGAELDLCQNISQEYGSLPSYSPDPLNQLSGTSPHNQSSNRETVPHAFTDFLARNGVSLDRPTRVEEYCLEPETPVVITGTVTENSPMQADSPATTSAAASNNQRLVLAKPVVEQPEVIRLTNGATPQSTTQMSQQGKIAAALARAGLATADMWVTSEGGLQAINSLIDSHSRPDQLPADTKFEALATRALAWTPVTMAKGSDDTTFIISNRHQSPKPPSLGWKSVALVLAGSTLTTISLYVLLLAHLR